MSRLTLSYLYSQSFTKQVIHGIGTWGGSTIYNTIITDQSNLQYSLQMSQYWKNFSKPRSLILERWADQIQALDTLKSGPSTGPWPCCWTRDITRGLVLGSNRNWVAVSLSLDIALITRESNSGVGESMARR